MLPALYQNQPRDFIVDAGHCAITQLMTRRTDYRAVVEGGAIANMMNEGLQLVRILNEQPDGTRKPSGQYFVIVVHAVRIASFAALLQDQEFLAQTPEKTAIRWAEAMQKAYAGKKNTKGEKAFPRGLQAETVFIVYDFTPQVAARDQDFLTAQYLFYKGKLPPQILTDWKQHYGQSAIDNIVRRSSALLQNYDQHYH